MIIFNNDLVGVWFIRTSESDWLAGLSQAPTDVFRIDYRFQYFEVELRHSFGGGDAGRWFQGTLKGDSSSAAEYMRYLAHMLELSLTATLSEGAVIGPTTEILRIGKSLHEFRTEVLRLPQLQADELVIHNEEPVAADVNR
jgi:hypothetical protein